MYNLIMLPNDVRREILIGRHLLRLHNFYLRSFVDRKYSEAFGTVLELLSLSNMDGIVRLVG